MHGLSDMTPIHTRKILIAQEASNWELLSEATGVSQKGKSGSESEGIFQELTNMWDFPRWCTV